MITACHGRLIVESNEEEFNAPEIKGGLRIELIDGLLATDLTINTTTIRNNNKAVFAIGVAFTP